MTFYIHESWLPIVNAVFIGNCIPCEGLGVRVNGLIVGHFGGVGKSVFVNMNELELNDDLAIVLLLHMKRRKEKKRIKREMKLCMIEKG